MRLMTSLLILMLAVCPFPVAADPDFKALTKALESKVRASGLPSSELSLYITAGEAESAVVLDVNSAKALIPASITKLATASAIFAAFPPGTKFKTALLIDADPKGSVLKGNLYLRGGGDPGFVSENMWFLVNNFLRTEVSKVEGDIIVDDTLFDAVRYDESRESARVDRAYDAPVGAMSFNWNSINVFVRPGEVGKPAKVFLDPENGYTKLVNKTKTIKGSGNGIAVSRNGASSGDTITVSGTIGSEKGEVVIYKNITKPDHWAGENLKAFLAQRGVVVTGKVKTGATPSSAKVAAEAESKPIEHLLADMNKFSNNYVAEMLTKNLASQTRKPATLSHGIARITEHLKSLGVSDAEMTFVNPSGLTRDNRMSAKGLWKVLHHLRQDFRIQPELLTSLPIAGVDGTLKRRMVGSSAERWVRAKTGLLTGVTALAGYAGRKDGTVFTFVFIHNGSRDESRTRRLFDDWLIRLID